MQQVTTGEKHTAFTQGTLFVDNEKENRVGIVVFGEVCLNTER